MPEMQYISNPELRAKVDALPEFERFMLMRGSPLRGYTAIKEYMERRGSLPYKLGDTVETKEGYWRRITGTVVDIFYDQKEVCVSTEPATGFESWGYDELDNFGQ